MLLYGPSVVSSGTEKGVACARCVISAVGGVQLMHSAGCAEKSSDTLCVPGLQKCAHVLQCAGNVRNVARVRKRPTEWVVCTVTRVRGALVLSFASARSGSAWCVG